MKMQLSSRLILHGLVLGASTLLALMQPSGAQAQAQGDRFISGSSQGGGEAYDSTCDTFSSQACEGDSFCSGGDSFRTIGDSFSSSGDQFVSSGGPAIQKGTNSQDYNHAFADDEELDPSLYTWSDDPHDPFAARTADSLPQRTSSSKPRNAFSFISVSDGPQIKAEKKNFDAPKAHPQYEELYIEGERLPQPIEGTTIFGSGDDGTKLYGWHYTHGQVRVYFAGDTATVRDGLVKQTFISCMRDWCQSTEGLLRFTVVEDFRTADIILCREFTSSHELAENMPSFRNCWLERVKIRLIDSTCDTLGAAQLRAVLLHSAGHALGYFGHTLDQNSAMNENCSHVNHPIQKMCPCDTSYIRKMYVSYKTCWDNRFKKDPPPKVVRVPWGAGRFVSYGLPVSSSMKFCQTARSAKHTVQQPLRAQRGAALKLPLNTKKIAAGL